MRKIPGISELTKRFSTAVVNANTGTGPGLWAAGDDSRITGALQADDLDQAAADLVDSLVGALYTAIESKFQVSGDYALASTVASFGVMCIWTGSAWTTLDGDAVPTDAGLIRLYSSVTHDSAGVTNPTHYSQRDMWFKKPT